MARATLPHMPSPSRSLPEARDLLARYRRVRETTRALAAGLSAEDALLQSMPDTSPTKWHLAHGTWFFEQFVLIALAGRTPIHDAWLMLFNSYYESVGPRHARPSRGILSRPGLPEVMAYRGEVDDAITAHLQGDPPAEHLAVIEIGLHHEQQHQELILTDILHAFSQNPLAPAYRRLAPRPVSAPLELAFHPGASGVVEIGHAGPGFAFDCETPRHRVVLHPHALANRPVTNAEYREFIEAGGYRTSTLWLAAGWNVVAQQGWERPLYWSADLAEAFTLGGLEPLDPNAPVCHVSLYEADAFARWAGARLPTEAEWEHAAASARVAGGNFVEAGFLRPVAAEPGSGLKQLFGDVWEWTASPLVGYPGYRPWPGSLGEYNGKFMSGQWVLRGGSCVSPADHLRATYRNFFFPADRWQFSGLRLAKDA